MCFDIHVLAHTTQIDVLYNANFYRCVACTCVHIYTEHSGNFVCACCTNISERDTGQSSFSLCSPSPVVLPIPVSLSLPPLSSSPVDRSLFQVKEVVPQATRKEQSSTLARLLNEYDQRSANPFFEYSRFNGDVSICTDSTISWLTQFIYGGKFSLVQNFHLYT